jgi:hypothetical protein
VAAVLLLASPFGAARMFASFTFVMLMLLAGITCQAARRVRGQCRLSPAQYRGKRVGVDWTMVLVEIRINGGTCDDAALSA